MHLLVIGINYFPEQTSVAPFTTGVCEHLLTRGHRVSVITAFPYYPHWRTFDGYRGSWYRREVINGVDVRRVAHYVPSKPRNLVQRLLHDITFTLNASAVIPLVGEFDAIFCSSPPPFVPNTAWLGGRLCSKPFAMKLTDVASSAAASLGMLRKQNALWRLALKLEKFNYDRARGISVLCSAFSERLIRQGVEAGKISVVPDWAEVGAAEASERDNAFRRRHGFTPEDFLAVHTGNMGLKQGLRTVVEAAGQATANIKWLLVGDGEERVELGKMARDLDTTTLSFLPLQPKEQFPSVLAAADVLLLVQKASVIDSVIPSKLLTYMAAGRPIVGSVHAGSETASRIREANCGLIVPPEDPEALVQAVIQLRADRSQAKRLGMNGRAYVEENFSKEKVLDRYDKFFGKVFSCA